jgi:hypothetical protein
MNKTFAVRTGWVHVQYRRRYCCWLAERRLLDA